MKLFSHQLLGVLTVLIAVFIAASDAPADTLYSVNIDTSGLIANPAGPFTLDFQLNEGGPSGNNSAIISGFNFGGGSPLGSATAGGGGSGDLSSTIVINETGFFNYVDQSFTAGISLSFHVQLTGSVNTGPGESPDQFSFGILNWLGTPLPTTDPSGAGAIFAVNVDSLHPAALQYSDTGGNFGPVVVTATPVIPLPSVAPAGLALCAMLLIAKWLPRRVMIAKVS